jgi:hypothetical protein
VLIEIESPYKVKNLALVGRQEVDVAVTDIAPWPAFSFGDGDRARRYFLIGSTVHEQVTHPW